MSSMGRFRRLRVPTVLGIVVGILAVWAIVRWAPGKLSETAEERLAQLDFRRISQWVIDFKRENGRLPSSFSEIEVYARRQGYSLMCSNADLPLSTRVRLTDYPVSSPLGKIAVLGSERDKLGMLWAVTEDGVVLKLYPADLE